jgi:hypothetical protein
MGLVLQVLESGALPSVAWRWEPETDILAGSLHPQPSGVSGSLELSGPDGSVAVVDLVDGGFAGLDVVVWPEVVTVPELAVPAPSRQGKVRVGGAGAGASVLELETQLSARANPGEDVIHFRVGAPRPSRVIAVADHLLVEVDDGGGLAGFWLTAVPPLLSAENGP